MAECKRPWSALPCISDQEQTTDDSQSPVVIIKMMMMILTLTDTILISHHPHPQHFHLDELHVAITLAGQDDHVSVGVVEGNQDSRRHVQSEYKMGALLMMGADLEAAIKQRPSCPEVLRHWLVRKNVVTR